LGYYVFIVVLPELPKWSVSPEYVAMIVTVLGFPVAAKKTAQLAVELEPLRVQADELKAQYRRCSK